MANLFTVKQDIEAGRPVTMQWVTPNKGANYMLLNGVMQQWPTATKAPTFEQVAAALGAKIPSTFAPAPKVTVQSVTVGGGGAIMTMQPAARPPIPANGYEISPKQAALSQAEFERIKPQVMSGKIGFYFDELGWKWVQSGAHSPGATVHQFLTAATSAQNFNDALAAHVASQNKTYETFTAFAMAAGLAFTGAAMSGAFAGAGTTATASAETAATTASTTATSSGASVWETGIATEFPVTDTTLFTATSADMTAFNSMAVFNASGGMTFADMAQKAVDNATSAVPDAASSTPTFGDTAITAATKAGGAVASMAVNKMVSGLVPQKQAAPRPQPVQAAQPAQDSAGTLLIAALAVLAFLI